VLSLAAVFTVLYYTVYKNAVIFSLMVTFVTMAYHCIYRILISLTVPLVQKRGWLNENGLYFREKKFEAKLYKLLRVKAWKDKYPVYGDRNTFQVNGNLRKPIDTIVQITMSAELVHALGAPLGFLSILLCFWTQVYGWDIAVFAVTATVAAIVEICPLMIQRYNRPRYIKLREIIKKREQAKTVRITDN
jgi:hypothetical protein